MLWSGDYWVEETLITENMTANTLNCVENSEIFVRGDKRKCYGVNDGLMMPLRVTHFHYATACLGLECQVHFIYPITCNFK